jgi:hypothetical protein
VVEEEVPAFVHNNRLKMTRMARQKGVYGPEGLGFKVVSASTKRIFVFLA